MNISSPNRKSLIGGFVVQKGTFEFELTEDMVQTINQKGRCKITPDLKIRLEKAVEDYIKFKNLNNQSPLRGEVYKELDKFENAIIALLSLLDGGISKDVAISCIEEQLIALGRSIDLEQDFLVLKTATYVAKEKLKAEFHYDTGADNSKNFLLCEIEKIYRLSNPKGQRLPNFRKEVLYFIPEDIRPELSKDDSVRRQTKRLSQKLSSD